MGFVDEFGLTVDEVMELRFIAEEAIRTDKAVLARTIANLASPKLTERIRHSLVAGSFKTLSKVGQASLMLLSRDNPDEFQSFEGVLNGILVDPLAHRDIATWCFYFALHECSANFQLDRCPNPTEEGQLTGLLLGEISAQCEAWRKIAAVPLNRTEVTLSLERIDLSILGGEQETGGDFGLIVEFKNENENHVNKSRSAESRIVPMIFQAKRYVRPKADVSQMHETRGYQYDLLSRNKCLSTYVFYENGTNRLAGPAPPLFKPVSRVCPPPSRTAVFEDSLDLPTYFINALHDGSFAPGATSPDEALRMIYGSAHAGQLSRLAVISNSRNAVEPYANALIDLREKIRNLQTAVGSEDLLTH